MVGPAHGNHQAVGGPHGEIDGKDQAEPQHSPAGGLAHIGQIALHHVHNPCGEQRVQGTGNIGYIQLQQAQQAAEKDHQGEEHKEEIVSQRGGLLGNPVEEVSFDCFGQKAAWPALLCCLHPIRQIRLLLPSVSRTTVLSSKRSRRPKHRQMK